MTIPSCATPPPAHTPRSAPHAGVMTECSRILRLHANNAMSALHDTLQVEVDTLWRQTYDAAQSDTLGELLRALQRSDDAVPRAFAESLDRLMGERSGRPREAERSYHAQHFADVVLSLVDDVVFSESLLIGNLARQIHTASESELRDLIPRISVLQGVEGEVEEARNPLAPEIIAEALKDACWALDCGLQARQTALTLIAGRIADALPAAYRAINAHLVERKVLPRVRQTVRRGGRPGVTQTRRTPEVADMLRRLVGQEVAAAAGVPLRMHAANDAVMDGLTQLQQGEGSFKLGGQQFSVNVGTADTVNVVRALLDAGINRQVGALDGAIIDIVATLFDFIFDDERVPTLMKGLIGRLQLPVLKLALSDHEFFSDRQHPARALINTLAQAASTWDGEFTPDSSLYLIAEPLVQRIQNSGGNDGSTFETSLSTLGAFLSEQERLADEKAVMLTERLTEREVSEIALSVATGTVARYLEDDSVPDIIQRLLATRWTSVLADAARTGGENGDAWIEAQSTMDDLVWSVQAKTSADDRQRLVRLLPGLISRLKRGFDACGAPDDERSVFFAELVKLHANAVKSGMQTAVSKSRQPGAMPPAQGDFPPDDGLDELERGNWVELLLEGNQRRAVRLTWISPARTMFLFANRQGARAVALTRSELARKFDRGEALLIDDEPLMDRLVANVLDEYQPQAEGISP